MVDVVVEYVIEIFIEDGVFFVNIVEIKEFIIDNLRVKIGVFKRLKKVCIIRWLFFDFFVKVIDFEYEVVF